MKYLITLLFIAALTGCAKDLTTVRVTPDSNGNPLQTITTMSSKEYQLMSSVQSAESARAECYRSSAISPQLDPYAQVAAIVAQAAGKGVDCGNGYNDALIATENRKANQTATRWGFAGNALKAVGTAYLGGKVIDGVTNLGAAALSSAGNQINATDGSEINLNGNVGEGNAFTSSEEIGGIPLESGTIEPIALGAASEEVVAEESTEIACLSIRGVLDDDPVGIDANGDGQVCSDGSGGVVDI